MVEYTIFIARQRCHVGCGGLRAVCTPQRGNWKLGKPSERERAKLFPVFAFPSLLLSARPSVRLSLFFLDVKRRRANERGEWEELKSRLRAKCRTSSMNAVPDAEMWNWWMHCTVQGDPWGLDNISLTDLVVPISTWAAANLADLAQHLGRMVDSKNLSQQNVFADLMGLPVEQERTFWHGRANKIGLRSCELGRTTSTRWVTLLPGQELGKNLFAR